MIPVMKPQLPRAHKVIPYLERMDSAGIYSNFGPLVNELELRYGEFLGAEPECVVSVANATLGIQGSCSLFPPTDWIVPAYTFAATLHALFAAKLSPILTDIDPQSFELDVSDLETSLDAGIVPVMPFGKRPDPRMFPPDRFVVIDAAASIGASEGALSSLPPKNSVIFSLHATKVLGAGEGGLVVFGNRELAQKFRQWTNFGFDESRTSLFPATNAKMSEMQAAYALAALDDWVTEKSQWESALELGNSVASDTGIESSVNHLEGVRPYWIAKFGTSELRDSVESMLVAHDVQTRRWWSKPVNMMPAFSRLSSGRIFPMSEHVSDTILGLPMYRGLSIKETEVIRAAIQEGMLNKNL